MSSCLSRRHFLGNSAFNLGSLGLLSLLEKDGLLAANVPEKPLLERVTYDSLPKHPHHAPRAKAMISLFMGGGPSHVDLFDPKPLLNKWDGKTFPGGEIKFDNVGGATKTVMGSPFKFTPQGESGMELSELIPHTASIADDICLIRSMNLTGIRNHVAGMKALDTGSGLGGRPALGSWLSYGLGSESQNLPSFVALVVGKNPPGSPYWASGLLPSVFQGTHVREQQPRIMNLDPPAYLKGAAQEKQLSLLDKLNGRHLLEHPGELDLQARIASYQLAARMQTAASEALDIRNETAATKALYGVEDARTKRLAEACIIARRLVERGVRFVQIWDYSWDMHENINEALQRRCAANDQPSAALVKDLKSRGMLDDTLVFWGGEMGRLPVIQGRGNQKPGRDHNTDGFSIWMAGGGVKQGHIHGATDEWGLNAVDQVVHHYDYLATVLHLFGLDANKLTYKRNGRAETILNGEPGQVVKGILA
ncbi:MAG: DUF1501 domain-containing protein [Verrucomicrobiota bacterium]